MRLRKTAGMLVLAVPLALAGCGVLGLEGTVTPRTPTATAPPGPVSDAGWIVTAPGSATPSPPPTVGGGTRAPGLPPVSFLPTQPGCGGSSTADPVLIPLTVKPGAGTLTVTWPRQYDSDYRIAAVPQPLVHGEQPAFTWQAVPRGTGCTVTATIRGLRSGTPYVVWLDAPNTGHETDGTRHPYSGRSGVVHPR